MEAFNEEDYFSSVHTEEYKQEEEEQESFGFQIAFLEERLRNVTEENTTLKAQIDHLSMALEKANLKVSQQAKIIELLNLENERRPPPNTIPPVLPSSIPPLQISSPTLLPTSTIEERLEANEQRLEKMSHDSWRIKEEVGKIKRERGTDKEKLSEQEIKRKANLMVQNAERERDHLARLLEMVESKHNKYDSESSQQESGDSWEDSRSSHTSNLSSDGEFKIKLKDTGRKKDVPRVVEVIKDNFFSIMEEYENEKNYSQAELIQVRNDIKKMYSKVINYAVDG